MSGKKKLYESYNAMSRPAMWANIPIMPLIGFLMVGLVSLGTGTVFLGLVWGTVISLPSFAALLALRIMTSVDDRYLNRVWFGFRRIILNIKYGKHLLLTSLNPMWSRYYGRRFSQKRVAAGAHGATDGIPRSPEHGDDTR